MRLLRLHEMNRIVYPKKVWNSIEKCLIDATMPDKVAERVQVVMADTSTEEFAKELEFALVETHGESRYAGEPERLRHEIEKASVWYMTAFLMDDIYAHCGHTLMRRSRRDLLEDAAWYAVEESQRGRKG